MGLSDDVKNIFSMAKELIENAAEDEGVKIKLEVTAEEKASESFDDISDKLDELDGKLGDLEIEAEELLDCIDICKSELDDLNDMVDELETDDGEDEAFQDGRDKLFDKINSLEASLEGIITILKDGISE